MSALMSSEVIRGHQWSSVVIRGHQLQSISAHLPSHVTRTSPLPLLLRRAQGEGTQLIAISGTHLLHRAEGMRSQLVVLSGIESQLGQ